MYIIEKFIKDAFAKIGMDVGRLKPHANPDYPIFKALEYFDIDMLLDVGANTGQFAVDMRAVGYKNKIVSFEPLSAAHAELTRHAQKDKLWTVHPRCAIGSQNGEIKINIAGNSVSSSIMPMLDSHSSVVSESAYCGEEITPIFTLDAIAGEYIKNARQSLLKIDTQGYEWEVLNGAQSILPQLRGVLCEMSLVPLYENQYLWMDIIARMQASGFTLWSVKRGFTDPVNGRALQIDGLFIRL